MKQPRRPMGWLYLLGWSGSRFVFRFYFRWTVMNAERVPLDGPVIFASNHASILDPPMVGAAVRRPINYLAKQSLFSLPVLGWVLRNVNAIPVDREGGGAKGLRAILGRLLQGQGIILFPEGTRSLDGQLQPARPGIGLAVLKSDAPVVPVRVLNTFEAFRKGRVIPRPVRVAIRFGEPMRFEKLRAEASGCSKERLKELYQEVADQLMAAIANLGSDQSSHG